VIWRREGGGGDPGAVHVREDGGSDGFDDRGTPQAGLFRLAFNMFWAIWGH